MSNKKHICQYCKAETSQPDEQCYANPNNIMKKQTAVEWLVEKIYMTDFETYNFMLENGDFEQAKAMEKEQIENAWCDGNDCISFNAVIDAKQYYNDTFN
jgi:hypothetical protein